MDLKNMIRHVPDFPKTGIDFLDITPVLLDGRAFEYVIDCFVRELEDIQFDLIASFDARGFLFAAPVAYALKKGHTIIRKKGKLPWKTISVEYELEYGSDIFEMHADGVKPGQRVVIVDDLLATGGTIEAGMKLVEQSGGKVVKSVFFIELEFLNGRNKLEGHDIFTLVKE
jgi:adenine phosphoribosyltransferase